MRPQARDGGKGAKRSASRKGSGQTGTANEVQDEVCAPGRGWRLALWGRRREDPGTQGGWRPPTWGNELRFASVVSSISSVAVMARAVQGDLRDCP
jgi:hypothetical protein